MKRIGFVLALVWLLAVPVSAMELTPPTVPPQAEQLLPAETESFAEGLWSILKSAIAQLAPNIAAAAGSALAITAIVLLASVFNATPGNSKRMIRLVCAISLATILIGQANTMVNLCAGTIREISDYGKLLLPVLTTGLAAQGGVTSATALYAGTTVFNTVLTAVIGKVLVPMVYIYLALSVANSAAGEELLKKLRDFVKWLMIWCLKTILYVYTAYMSITGVITGTADAAAVKAAKLTISGVVPVVGGILSDASETVLVSAGVMKNAVGIYGCLAVTAILILPFMRIAVQYLILKLTAALCGVFGVKNASELIEDFSTAMGVLLGMAGAVSFLMLISIICFMKGMG